GAVLRIVTAATTPVNRRNCVSYQSTTKSDQARLRRTSHALPDANEAVIFYRPFYARYSSLAQHLRKLPPDPSQRRTPRAERRRENSHRNVAITTSSTENTSVDAPPTDHAGVTA